MAHQAMDMVGNHNHYQTNPKLQENYYQPSKDDYPIPQQPGLEVAPQHQSTYSEYQSIQQYHNPNDEGSRSRRNPYGLSPLAFGFLVALITAIIIGGAVGGGLGGACKSFRSSSNSDAGAVKTVTQTAHGSATAISTASFPTDPASQPPLDSLEQYIAPEAKYIDSLFNPCSELDSTQNGPINDQYSLACGTDISNGDADTDTGDIIADVVGIFAYSIQDCIYACSSMNNFRSKWDYTPHCKSLTWASNMAGSNSSGFANCWLKNGTFAGYQCNNCVSATVISEGDVPT